MCSMVGLEAHKNLFLWFRRGRQVMGLIERGNSPVNGVETRTFIGLSGRFCPCPHAHMESMPTWAPLIDPHYLVISAEECPRRQGVFLEQ